MKNQLEKLLRIELIGANIKIIGKDIQGKIIDETKNMFTIKTKKSIKKIIKKGSIMRFKIKDEDITITGDKLIARPEDRIKLKVKI